MMRLGVSIEFCIFWDNYTDEVVEDKGWQYVIHMNITNVNIDRDNRGT